MSSVAGTSGSQGYTQETPAPVAKSTVNKETFLQLLVAQVRHQDPLNPADGTQFLTQLAQFSELEQMIDIRAEVAALRADINEGKTKQPDGEGTGA